MVIDGVQTVHDGDVEVRILYPVGRRDEAVVHDVFPDLYIFVNRHILLQSTHRDLDVYTPFHSFRLHIQLDVVCHRHCVHRSLLVDLDLALCRFTSSMISPSSGESDRFRRLASAVATDDCLASVMIENEG